MLDGKTHQDLEKETLVNKDVSINRHPPEIESGLMEEVDKISTVSKGTNLS